ncbi:MAG: PP2C family serine/threonine-protein phosphatase [Patescibacteria group bacterium]
MSARTKLWGVAAAKGKRVSMEDAHFFIETPNGWIAGLFDGHGGSEGSAEAARLFAEELAAIREFSLTDEYLTDLFRRVDQALTGKNGGTTALVVIRSGDDCTCAVAGDSQCLMLEKEGALVINEPHDLTNDEERARIVQTGGRIINRHGIDRVANDTFTGSLMVTRALNDPEYQKAGVIPDPEIIHFTNELPARFLGLVCDGIWQNVSVETMGEICRGKRSPQIVADQLVRTALAEGSNDNCTALVVRL